MPSDTQTSSVHSTSAPPNRATQRPDLEIKDAQIIFNTVWEELEQELGRTNLRFPKEIFWLNGAPGAGKGTHTRYIMQLRDLTEEPIVVSALLNTPEAKKVMDSGRLVGDREVTRLVFRKLLDDAYKSGAVVDGYPRTKVQVECLKLLYEKLNELSREMVDTLLAEHFPKPQFHIIVLFIDEDESVRRQLRRGQQMLAHNEEVRASGMGELIEVRKTDLSADAAHKRYQTFKELTYNSLKSLQQVFHYHYINAHGTVTEVQHRIVRELKYQSSLELNQDTYNRLARLPLANEISRHARQELVRRLDGYEQQHTQLFKRVVELIERKMMPIVRAHAITGQAHINSEDSVFEDSVALAMLIDVFSERGFHAVVDVRKERVPERIDPKSFEISCRIQRIYRITVHFPGSEIRRGG